MTAVHIVLFQFKPTLHLEQINDFCTRMLALDEQCIHPTTKRPYVKSIRGGKDSGPDKLRVGGYSHGFVMEFDSEEDRKYYLEKDPAHQQLVAETKDLVQSVRILDFQPGVF